MGIPSLSIPSGMTSDTAKEVDTQSNFNTQSVPPQLTPSTRVSAERQRHSQDLHVPEAKSPRTISSTGSIISGGLSITSIDGAQEDSSTTKFRHRNSLADDDAFDADQRLFGFAEELRSEPGPPEPWFLEMTTLRRFNFIDINNRLAECKKKFFDNRTASEEDMRQLRVLLHDQAEAIRDMEYIRSLDFLPSGEERKRHDQSVSWFPEIGKSIFDTDAFGTENYRMLRPHKAADPYHDEVRRFLMTILPKQMTWTEKERKAKKDFYEAGYRPTMCSGFVERLARFMVAMAGALFVLVPMYIMALHQDPTKNLVTTTVAVVVFAVLCSITLRTSNDQTLAVTTAYAAVLMVFVGLTAQGNRDGD